MRPVASATLKLLGMSGQYAMAEGNPLDVFLHIARHPSQRMRAPTKRVFGSAVASASASALVVLAAVGPWAAVCA